MFPQVIKTFYILAVIGHSCRCVWQLSHTHWGWHRVRESYRWSFSGLVRGLRGQKTLKHPISPFETFPLVLLLLHLSAQNTPESEVLQSRLLQWAHTWNIQGGTNPDSPFGSRGTISEQLCCFVTSFIDKSCPWVWVREHSARQDSVLSCVFIRCSLFVEYSEHPDQAVLGRNAEIQVVVLSVGGWPEAEPDVWWRHPGLCRPAVGGPR